MKKILFIVKRKKVLSFSVGILLLVGIGFSLFGKKTSKIETYSVKRGDITETVMETGNVQAAQMSVYSTINGVVEDIYVKNGDEVVKGQKLFSVKSTSTDQEKASAYQGYLNALSDLKKTKQGKEAALAQLLENKKLLTDAEADREYQKDHDINPQTKEEYSSEEKRALKENIEAKKQAVASSQEAYDNADTSISSAQANVDAKKLAYGSTLDRVMTAQVSGLVSNLSVGKGDAVYVSDITVTSTSIADPVLMIGRLSDYLIKVSISEMERSKVRLGQKAVVKFDAVSGREYLGKVEKLDDFGTEDSGVITYNAYLALDDPDERILPNMTANVTIETDRKENALLVPSKALKPYRNGKGVQVENVGAKGEKRYEYVAVRTGLKNGSQVEILEGLSEGSVISLSADTANSAK